MNVCNKIKPISVWHKRFSSKISHCALLRTVCGGSSNNAYKWICTFYLFLLNNHYNNNNSTKNNVNSQSPSASTSNHIRLTSFVYPYRTRIFYIVYTDIHTDRYVCKHLHIHLHLQKHMTSVICRGMDVVFFSSLFFASYYIKYYHKLHAYL